MCKFFCCIHTPFLNPRGYISVLNKSIKEKNPWFYLFYFHSYAGILKQSIPIWSTMGFSHLYWLSWLINKGSNFTSTLLHKRKLIFCYKKKRKKNTYKQSNSNCLLFYLMNDTHLGHRRQINYIKLLLLFFLICIALFWQLSIWRY